MSEKRPNPSDPSLVDVYDDMGNYVTTLPQDQSAIEQTANPQVENSPGGGTVGDFLKGLGSKAWDAIVAANDASTAAADRAPRRPLSNRDFAPMVDSPSVDASIAQTFDRRAPGVTTVDKNTDVIALEPGQADRIEAEMGGPSGLVSLEPGAADQAADALPEQEQAMLGEFSPGGIVEKQRQTSGMSPDAVGRFGQGIEQLAQEERAAVLDEALAREMQLEQDQKRQAELEREVKDGQAKHAIEQKQIFDRRKTVEDRIATVANQEPDRRRAFPTGFGGVMTFIGAIAGGMLQGLQGGSNPTLDALMRRLDEDVEQQRLTQSEQLKELTRQLGSIDAAEDMLRAKQKEIVLKETEARLLGSQNKVAPAQIDAFRKRMNAEISRHRIDALTKLERDLTIQEVNQPGSAPVAFSPEAYRAKSLEALANLQGREVKEVHKDWNTWTKGFKERANLRSGLETAQRAIEKFEQDGDVAGLGALGKNVPTMLAGKDALAVRQVLGNVVAQYLKQVSGAAVTEQEFARTIDNLQGAGDYDSVKRGLGILNQSIRSADEEDQVQNPGFYQLRGELQSLTRRGRGQGAGRDEQNAAVADVVRIPQSSRIAYVHNNPGNLTFAGQAGATRGEPKAGGGYWAKFESPGDGLRALARQVQKDQARNLNVRQFVEKYAPAGDSNNVEQYLLKLQRLTGADEETMLSEMSAGNLAYALAAIESGSRPVR